MTNKEANHILAILKAAYPAGYQKVTEPDLIVTVKLWAKTFKDWEHSDVENAVGAIIATRKSDFPPSPGAVMDQLIKNTSVPEMTEMEAWELVFKAVKNSSWHAEEEFKKLPPVLQRSVGSPEMLRSWAGMDGETVNSVIQSNFMRTFRSRKEQDREYLALPESVKETILGLSEGIGA